MSTYVRTLDREVIEVRRVAPIARAAQVIDFLFGLVYAVLALRLVLDFIGARTTGFVSFVATISDPLYAPFRGIVGNMQIDGHPVTLSIVVAMIAYGILHLIINRLLRMIAVRRTAL